MQQNHPVEQILFRLANGYMQKWKASYCRGCRRHVACLSKFRFILRDWEEIIALGSTQEWRTCWLVHAHPNIKSSAHLAREAWNVNSLSLLFSVCVNVCVCVYVCVCVSVCMSVCLSAWLPACLSACLPVCMSVCLSVWEKIRYDMR